MFDNGIITVNGLKGICIAPVVLSNARTCYQSNDRSVLLQFNKLIS